MFIIMFCTHVFVLLKLVASFCIHLFCSSSDRTENVECCEITLMKCAANEYTSKARKLVSNCCWLIPYLNTFISCIWNWFYIFIFPNLVTKLSLTYCIYIHHFKTLYRRLDILCLFVSERLPLEEDEMNLFCTALQITPIQLIIIYQNVTFVGNFCLYTNTFLGVGSLTSLYKEQFWLSSQSWTSAAKVQINDLLCMHKILVFSVKYSISSMR